MTLAFLESVAADAAVTAAEVVVGLVLGFGFSGMVSGLALGKD